MCELDLLLPHAGELGDDATRGKAHILYIIEKGIHKNMKKDKILKSD